nr:hypothetical protein [Tanacetum cinerariifolium]
RLRGRPNAALLCLRAAFLRAAVPQSLLLPVYHQDVVGAARLGQLVGPAGPAQHRAQGHARQEGVKLSDRISGKPVQVDLSDEPMKKQIIFNRNKFILGPSGSGKSFFTNHMVRQYYEQGAHVLLVDTGNSYKGLCELKGGVYFTYEEDDPIAFNPFLVSGKLDVEKKESIKTLLQALWKKDDETVSQSEYVSLSTAVSLYYVMLEENSSIRPSFNTFYEFVKGPYSELLLADKVREKDFDIDNFLYVLKPYYRGGEYDYLLNSPKELDLVQSPFIVFELDNIKDHPILFPVVTLIIMETFISKMRKLKGRKFILKFDQIQSLLSLTEKEKALILSINRDNKPERGRYTEVFISLGGVVSKVYSIEVSKEEYITYTTEE